MSEITSLSLSSPMNRTSRKINRKGQKLSDQQEGIWIGQNVKEATFLAFSSPMNRTSQRSTERDKTIRSTGRNMDWTKCQGKPLFLGMRILWLMPQLWDNIDNSLLQLDGAPSHW
ncbi:hypothetical protein TNCV_906281 [Trichonephila clavipes]|nr:hypothetical protein TNCV_906281 [Trichonephila clavipes]